MSELSVNSLEEIKKVSHALSSKIRLKMINLLNEENMHVRQLAKALQIPMSTAASHVRILEEANLIITKISPTSSGRGAMKVCVKNVDDIYIFLIKNQLCDTIY